MHMFQVFCNYMYMYIMIQAPNLFLKKEAISELQRQKIKDKQL